MSVEIQRYLIFRLCFVAVLISCCSVPLRAADPQEAKIDPRPLSWLKSGQYAALDAYYSHLQQGYESGSLSEQTLRQGFKNLYLDDKSNAQYLNQWVRTFPKSYAAITARGAFFYRMAWAVRGEMDKTHTSPAQIEAMHLYLKLARPDLRSSLQMTAKPYVSTIYLLDVAMLTGSSQEARQWLDLGVQIAPQNVLLRLRYMYTLTPRWGGSYQEMEAFLQECRREGLPDSTITALDEVIHEDLVETAIEHWIAVARTAWNQKDTAQADYALLQLAPLPVQDPQVLSQMGWIYVQEKRMTEAWGVLRKAANLGDAWSQYVVGKTTYLGCADIHLPANREAGRVWIQRSAASGFTEARTFLKYDHWAHVAGFMYLWLT